MINEGAEELTPRAAADRLGTSLRTVQRWISAGRLPARRVGGRWRVASDAIDAFCAPGPVDQVLAAARVGLPSASPASLRRVFVANRGEIGARIERTCRALGIAVHLPERDGPADLDLLDGPAVVAAARASGSDALHPGYGFLAERASFAEAVLAAGLRWIGPPPEAMRRMGDKAAARRLATRLGIPVVEGYDGDDQSDARFAAEARRIGWPLLVKPAAGGGGKGMHSIATEAELRDGLAAARREAFGAFGDPRLILERRIEQPRHVEVQVLFDRYGRGVHLGVRDCSIQRRHQKILEETPAPNVPAPVRNALQAAALRLAVAVGYESAGTVEFLLAEDGAWFFIEMNTRLQVEHPVTEVTWNRDLVADQLGIAAGRQLGIRQRDLRPDGHAIEVRIYAEDADHGFLPAIGVAALVVWPTREGVRIDTALAPGTEVGDRFDPLLAKVIAHGRTRAEARTRLRAALAETTILGLTTNLPFLRWLVALPAVERGRARTNTVDTTWRPVPGDGRDDIPPSAWDDAGRLLLSAPGDASRLDPWAGGWRLDGRRIVRVASGDVERTVTVGPTVRGGAAPAIRCGGVVYIDVGGRSVEFRVAQPPEVDRALRQAATHELGGPVEVLAPMPGRVLAIHATRDTPVGTADRLVTLEAMKMEHEVSSPIPGRVGEIAVTVGQQVTRGQLLVVVVP